LSSSQRAALVQLQQLLISQAQLLLPLLHSVRHQGITVQLAAAAAAVASALPLKILGKTRDFRMRKKTQKNPR